MKTRVEISLDKFYSQYFASWIQTTKYHKHKFKSDMILAVNIFSEIFEHNLLTN